jgi:hypothetical protein
MIGLKFLTSTSFLEKFSLDEIQVKLAVLKFYKVDSNDKVAPG